MGLRINNNAAASNAYRALSATDNQMAKSLEKLSSGFRINRAADDAAGLVISEALRSQVGGLKVAIRNAQDGISLVQTAEGALVEVHSMLQRMRDLAVQASNGTNSTESRAAADAEAQQLVEQITQIAASTKFNGVELLTGGTVDLQVGVTSTEQLSFTLASVTAPTVDLTTASGAGTAIADLDTAITTISTARGDLGARQNRLEHTINNLSVAQENLAASESRIRDTDMALEMTSFTRSQVLVQAGTAMLAQANASSQNVLQLLRG